MHPIERNDPLLRPLLEAPTAEERESVLEGLLAGHAYARIDRALDARYRQSGLSPSHREDLRAEVLLRLLNRLHALVNDDTSEPVASFQDYVAVVAFNTFDGLLRRSYPLRSKLKNRIRYALRHDPRLTERSHGGEPVAALAEWPQNGDDVADTIALDSLPRGDGNLRPLLLQILEQAGRPVTVSALTGAVAELQDIPAHNAIEPLALAEATEPRDFTEDLANAAFLRDVWNEIRELPVKQRVALLLSVRDASGESVVRFLPATGVASGRQIAEALELAPFELARLWEDLPLDDTRIALLLDATRQQVINLRQAARNRLARRLQRTPARGRRRS